MNNCLNLNGVAKYWYDQDSKCIYLKEYETKLVCEDEQYFNELANLPAKETNLLYIEKGFSEKKYIRIRSNSKIGVEKLGDFTIFVSPKIEAADFLIMLNYAYNFNLDLTKDVVYINKYPHYLSAVFIKYFLWRVREFIYAGIKRNFVQKREELVSKVKGKTLLSDYINKNLSSLKANVVPCQFYEIEYDCLENQIIRYTVDTVQRSLPNIILSKSMRSELRQYCNYISSQMSMVKIKKITAADFNKVRYVGKFRCYREIHELCRMIYECLQIELKGGKINFQSFSLDMNMLFEKFIIGVLKRLAGFNIDYQKEGKFHIGTHYKKIKLDGWLGENRIIIDTKYKEFLTAINENEQFIMLGNLKIKNADIYQMVAYCNHAQFEAHRGILIYPTTNEEDAGEETIFKVAGFKSDIYVLTINLNFQNRGNSKPKEILNFVEKFRELISQ